MSDASGRSSPDSSESSQSSEGNNDVDEILTPTEGSIKDSHVDFRETSDVKGLPPHHRNKAVVEDRTLQAVLAERRRSIEYNKSGMSRQHARRASLTSASISEEITQFQKNNIVDKKQTRFSKDAPKATKNIMEEFHMYPSLALDAVEEESVFSLELSDVMENMSDPYRGYRRNAQPRSETESTMYRGQRQIVSLRLRRELEQKRRQQIQGQLHGNGEMYTDKDRAAAVALGDQDIKTSLKNQQIIEGNRREILSEDMDANIYLMEAMKNIRAGKLHIALDSANKAAENGQLDSQTLFIRSKCYLLLGRLEEALDDSQQALTKDPNMVKALLVQAEVLYEMGEFERGLVLFHRGNRRRSDIATFARGIHKSKEAILNAIGSKHFPKKKMNSQSRQLTDGFSSHETESSKISKDFLGSSGFSSQKQKKNQDSLKPIMSSIKTSKIASKKLLGGLSSDKEFLTNLLQRKCITTRLQYTEPTKARNRRRSVNTPEASRYDSGDTGMDIFITAKDGLTSLQHLEAFLWQIDPNELSTCPKKKDDQLLVEKRTGAAIHENQQKKNRK